MLQNNNVPPPLHSTCRIIHPNKIIIILYIYFFTFRSISEYGPIIIVIIQQYVPEDSGRDPRRAASYPAVANMADERE